MNRTTRDKEVSQCVEEAALLWLRREHLVGESHLSLADLAEHDRQLQTRLNELIAAGDLAWRACQRELGWEEPGEIFPATILALAADSASRMPQVLDYALRSSELSRPLVAGLAWSPLDGIVDLLEDFLTAADSRLRRIGLAAAIAHRQIPESALSDALNHPDCLLRARALRGVGEMGCDELLSRVAEQVANGPRECRFEAAWTCAVRSRLPQALDVLLEAIRWPCHELERAICASVRLMDTSAAAAYLECLAGDPATQRAAIVGAGALGDPGLVDWLISLLSFPATSRVAGESVAIITGMPLDRSPFQVRPPEAKPFAPRDNDPWEEVVELGPDEHLPWPKPPAIADWWARHRAGYEVGTRYLLGRPVSIPWCRVVLCEGRQRQRAHAALELAIRLPAEPLFEVRAPGDRQRACLGVEGC
ncbi:MAG: TIGR02270 family protein [Pirellulaceae bacterium]